MMRRDELNATICGRLRAISKNDKFIGVTIECRQGDQSSMMVMCSVYPKIGTSSVVVDNTEFFDAMKNSGLELGIPVIAKAKVTIYKDKDGKWKRNFQLYEMYPADLNEHSIRLEGVGTIVKPGCQQGEPICIEKANGQHTAKYGQFSIQVAEPGMPSITLFNPFMYVDESINRGLTVGDRIFFTAKLLPCKNKDFPDMVKLMTTGIIQRAKVA